MKRIYTIIVIACITLQAQAQRLYNLQYCLELGLQNNYSLRIAHNDEQISSNNSTWANAGLLPTLDFTAGYTGSIDKSSSTSRETGVTTKTNGGYEQSANVGLNLNWTIFDGFNMTADYQKLQELKRQGETNTRLAIEDMVANIAAEYYNFVQQKIRLKNFLYAVSLSKERMRIVEARYHIGNFSRLDYQQAKVDFNADRAQYIKQQEALHTSRINLNELMAVPDVDEFFIIRDSMIDVNADLKFEELWESTLATNASLLQAEQNVNLAMLDYKKVKSRDYPYLRFNTGYGYTYNKFDSSSPTRKSGNLGFNAGLTLGFNIFDGNRRRERKNARLEIENSQLAKQELEQSLRADLTNLWQAYQNNLNLLDLEKQNLITARENHEIAMERYMLGDLSGIEMREAQQSLLDAEERILSVQYDIKLCEISLLQLSGKIMNYLKN